MRKLRLGGTSLLDLVEGGSTWDEVEAFAKAAEGTGINLLNTGIEVEAKQKVASAKAEADALALQRQQITADLLALRKIENEREAIRKWDGKLPQVTGGATPFIQLSPSKP